MNPSAPFILRPVATSLLMIAIMLVGMVGYLFLPLSALPEVDYPTIQVQSFYPGASPDVMTTSVTAILERQFGQMPGLKEMSSVSSAGSSVVTLQFDLNLNLDIAEQEVQAAINAGGSLLPQLPAPPVYAKVNPADAPVITLAVSSPSLPITTVEDLADTRIAQKISQLVGRRPGQHFRRPSPRRAGAGQSAAAGLLRPEHRRSAHHRLQQQFQRPQGQFRRRRPVLYHQRQRPAAERRRLRQHRGGLQERRAGASVRCRHRGAERREHQTLKLGEQDARRAAQCPAPARRQCHCGGGFDQGNPAADRGRTAGLGGREGADRPHQHHSRLGRRCRIRTDAGGGAGGAGDFRLPAQPARHLHSQPVGAALHRGHLRGHVSAGLFAQQSVA